MEWVFAILLGVAVLLLILSFFISNKTKNGQQEEQNAYYASLMKEMKDLQEQFQMLQLDYEIISQEANLYSSAEERMTKRKILDMHRRKYSIQSIAEKTNLTENEVKDFLEAYIQPKNKGKD